MIELNKEIHPLSVLSIKNKVEKMPRNYCEMTEKSQ